MELDKVIDKLNFKELDVNTTCTIDGAKVIVMENACAVVESNMKVTFIGKGNGIWRKDYPVEIEGKGLLSFIGLVDLVLNHINNNIPGATENPSKILEWYNPIKIGFTNIGEK